MAQGDAYRGNAFDKIVPNRQKSSDANTVGESTNKWDNMHATSGEFSGLRADHGVMVLAPNGSGWHLRVDDAGSMSIDGPVAL